MEGGRGERCWELKKRLAGRRFSIFAVCASHLFFTSPFRPRSGRQALSILTPQQHVVTLCRLMRVLQSVLFEELLRWAEMILVRVRQLPLLSSAPSWKQLI